MSLLTSWGEYNKVVNENLTTRYKREMANIQGYNYFKYTRTRTCNYSYIGMDKNTALSCAQYYNMLYNRTYYDQIWDPIQRRFIYSDSLLKSIEHKLQAGDAKPVKRDGDIWDVNINVNEVITQPYRWLTDFDEHEPNVFSEFENNPDKRFGYFKGITTEKLTDFNYDNL